MPPGMPGVRDILIKGELMKLRAKERWLESIPDAEGAPAQIAQWTEVLRALLLSDEIEELDDSSLDPLERTALALVGVIHTERLRRQGWQLAAWSRVAPDEIALEPAGWRDHPYVLVHPDQEYMLFCAEPYELRAEDLLDLATHAANGWNVHIDSGSTIHFPGRTLRVSLSRPRRSSAEAGQRWGWPRDNDEALDPPG
jgi:hypothetical protein